MDTKKQKKPPTWGKDEAPQNGLMWQQNKKKQDHTVSLKGKKQKGREEEKRKGNPNAC